MINWKQHNGLINFLIMVSTKSNYNQTPGLVNHTSIKLKQTSLGTNPFKGEQMGWLTWTYVSGHVSVYLRTETQTKVYLFGL